MSQRPVIRFFGGTWDSPMFDEAVRDPVPTPVGDTCFYCEESIVEGDRGLMSPVAVLGRRRGKPRGQLRPIHVECHLRSVMGGVAHLEGRCRCHGGTEVDYPGTVHEEALEVLGRVNAVRASRGMGPLWEQP